jgi:hypothetical protein
VAWCRKAPGRPARLQACADEAAPAGVEPKGREGERPREAKPKRAREPARGEIRDRASPNRQRDEAPEARPLSAAMPHAPKARQTPLIREGPIFNDRAEEPIPADGQSRGGATQ